MKSVLVFILLLSVTFLISGCGHYYGMGGMGHHYGMTNNVQPASSNKAVYHDYRR